jgi:glycosyltransferase involved in cell wall biosynthesis/tetratricopeptide (TPR) repeat protein
MGLSKKYYELFLKLKKEESFALAQKALTKAMLLEDKAHYYYELAMLFRRNGQWWQCVDNLEKALRLEPKAKIAWKLAYIESLEKMNHFLTVINVFENFNVEDFDAFSYVRYGYALEKENREDIANEMLFKAIELDDKNNSKILGIGVFYEKQGNWIEALKKYRLKAQEEPFNALLHYKTGLSYDRNYQWKDAEIEIGHALALEKNRAYFFNRLAFNYERQSKFKEASKAYRLAILKEKSPKSEQYYRLGYSLANSTQYKEACEAFFIMNNIKMEEDNHEVLEDEIITNGKNQLIHKILPLVENMSYLVSKKEIDELIKLLVKIRAWNMLERVYQWVLDRDNDSITSNYINLAYSQYKQQKYKESAQNFIEQKIIQKAHSVSEKKFETDKSFRVVATYAEYLKREELRDKTILYESCSMFENSIIYNIFITLLHDKYFNDYQHILVVDSLDLIPNEIKKIQNIIFVFKESNLYLKYLASSLYLINNGAFPSYFIRQKNQKYLNIEQILECEADITKEVLINKAKVSKDLLHTTHIININQNLIEDYALRAIYNGYFLNKESSIDEVIKFFFFDELIEIEKNRVSQFKRQSLLIYASFEPNGITSSLQNLLNVIDKTKYIITLIIDNNTVAGYENLIVEYSKEMNILIRTGRMVVTVEEQWIKDKFDVYNKLENIEMNFIFRKAYENEFKRLFSTYRFDNIIDFNGYRTFWSALFAFGNAKHKSIYLHNDMYKEAILRYPSLNKAFFLYKEFDKLISVSKSVSKSNMKLLNNKFNLNKDKFCFVNNLIDSDKYLQLADKSNYSASYQNFMLDKRMKFINVGRLSPEKGQEKLIKVFVKLLEKNKNIALYIMGKGVLEQRLLTLINKYNVSDNIILLGQQSNPYPFIKNAGCMVLTSLHEGQALVLLEALSVGTPCISTDIAGPRSVLEDGYGLLCEESIDGIQIAIENFINGKLKFKLFSPIKYNQDAIEMFNKSINIEN